MRRRFINNGHMIGSFLMDDNMSDPANIVGDIGGDAIMAIRAKIKRCAGKKNGDVMSVCYLDEGNSNIFPDGTSCVSANNVNMDIFVHFPTFYYKHEYIDEYRFRYYLSPDFVDGSWMEFSECLIGAYKGFAINSKLYSWSNVPTPASNQSFSTYKSYAAKRGDGYQLIDYDMHKILPWLFYAIYGTRDSRSILGRGRYTTEGLTTGLSNSLGNNDSTSDMVNVSPDFINGVSFLGLEDCWGSFEEAVEGIDKRGWFYRITNKLTNDIRDVYGYTTGNVYLRKMKNGEFLDVLPVEWGWGASKALHYCDLISILDGSNSAPLACFRGGDNNNGIASILFWNNSSYAGTSYGARLAYRGDISVVGDVQEFLSI